jgi:hypothetical protein
MMSLQLGNTHHHTKTAFQGTGRTSDPDQRGLSCLLVISQILGSPFEKVLQPSKRIFKCGFCVVCLPKIPRFIFHGPAAQMVKRKIFFEVLPLAHLFCVHPIID